MNHGAMLRARPEYRYHRRDDPDRLSLGFGASGLFHAAALIVLLALGSALFVPDEVPEIAQPVQLYIGEPPGAPAAPGDGATAIPAPTPAPPPSGPPIRAETPSPAGDATADKPARPKKPEAHAVDRNRDLDIAEQLVLRALAEQDPRYGIERAFGPAFAVSPSPVLRQAAERGLAFARYNLARALLTADSETNRSEARQWLDRAARQGHLPAMLKLAESSLRAGNDAAARIEALAWLDLAAGRGHEGARRARALLAARLAPADLGAARTRTMDLQRALDAAGAPTPRRQGELDRALRQAAARNRLDAVRELIADGADPEALDGFGRTVLIGAAWRGHRDMVRAMVESGVDVDARDTGGRSALTWSAINGYETMTGDLLDRGAAVGPRDGEGLSPLMRAAWNGHAAIVRALLAAGADPEARDNEGKSALDRARDQNDAAIIALLRAAQTN